MTNEIIIKKAPMGVYGQEYKALFYRNGTQVYSLVIFANDIKYIRNAYTADFANAKVTKKY